MRAAFLTRRALHSSCRRLNSTAPSRPLIDILLRNSELDAEDAQNELRWMRQALASSLDPGNQASELAAMAERRSRGEPLQYILGAFMKHGLAADFWQGRPILAH